MNRGKKFDIMDVSGWNSGRGDYHEKSDLKKSIAACDKLTEMFVQQQKLYSYTFLFCWDNVPEDYAFEIRSTWTKTLKRFPALPHLLASCDWNVSRRVNKIEYK